MFRTSITSTPFTSETANAYFANIIGRPFSNDVSFLATIRALVSPRIPDDEKVSLTFGSSSYNRNIIRDNSAYDVVRAIGRDYGIESAGNLIVHNLRGTSEDTAANFEAIEATFCDVFPGYHRLEKVKEFYRKSFNVDCYINPDIKSTIVFVDNLDNRKLHYLEVSILAFFPWYFDPNKGLAEDEFALIKSLRENKPDNYEACIGKLAEKYDFRTAHIKQLLKDFETRYERIELERITNTIRNIESNIKRLNQQIGDCLAERNEKLIRGMGLRQKIDQGGGEDSEIMEYFLCNKKLILEEVSDTDMFFSVKDYFEFFDKEIAESVIENRHSFVYTDARIGKVTANQMERLLREIFVSDSPRLRMRVCAAYQFNLHGNVRGVSGHEFGCEFAGHMPNPHINNYSCMGNYQQIINELLMENDYIGALEQCVASCKSLNWSDGTVMETFMRNMWRGTSESKCIELPNGDVVSPYEAATWLDEQDGVNDAENECIGNNETHRDEAEAYDF